MRCEPVCTVDSLHRTDAVYVNVGLQPKMIGETNIDAKSPSQPHATLVQKIELEIKLILQITGEIIPTDTNEAIRKDSCTR